MLVLGIVSTFAEIGVAWQHTEHDPVTKTCHVFVFHRQLSHAPKIINGQLEKVVGERIDECSIGLKRKAQPIDLLHLLVQQAKDQIDLWEGTLHPDAFQRCRGDEF